MGDNRPNQRKDNRPSPSIQKYFEIFWKNILEKYFANKIFGKYFINIFALKAIKQLI